jgi:hypothetical protein
VGRLLNGRTSLQRWTPCCCWCHHFIVGAAGMLQGLEWMTSALWRTSIRAGLFQDALGTTDGRTERQTDTRAHTQTDGHCSSHVGQEGRLANWT